MSLKIRCDGCGRLASNESESFREGWLKAHITLTTKNASSRSFHDDIRLDACCNECLLNALRDLLYTEYH